MNCWVRPTAGAKIRDHQRHDFLPEGKWRPVVHDRYWSDRAKERLLGEGHGVELRFGEPTGRGEVVEGHEAEELAPSLGAETVAAAGRRKQGGDA